MVTQVPYQQTIATGFDNATLEEAWIGLVRGEQRQEYGGAVALIVHKGEVVLHRSTGWAVREPVEQRTPMGPDEIFDLASLTKVVATTPSILKLIADGKLGLDQPVGEVLPAFGLDGEKAKITIRHLLTHTGGLSDWLPVYTTRGAGAENYLAEFAATQPAHPVGGQVIYSDPSFITLGEIVRAVSGKSIAQYAHDEIFGPLGMTETMFTPPKALWNRVAATELGNAHEEDKSVGDPVRQPWRNYLLRGEVHDGNAWYGFNGVAGHAGLFSTALDLAKYGVFWLNGGRVGDQQVIPADLMAEATTNQIRIEGATERRGLGWRMLPHGAPDPGDSGLGFSDQAYGHTGFTGTSLWMAPERELVVVLLTNRVHPDIKSEYLLTRAQFHTLVNQAFAAE